MRVLFLGNNWVGWKVAEFLAQGEDDLVALVIHPPGRRQYGDELVSAAGVDNSRIFDGSSLKDPDVVEAIVGLQPEIGVSAYFGYIVPAGLLERLPRGCINVHPGLLPYNRGAYPNVWSIVDGTAAGVTVHYLDEGIDTGDIVAQREVDVQPTDTGKTLYRRLERASVDLFRETWPSIQDKTVRPTPQDPDQATYHRVRDVERIDEIDPDQEYSGRELIDILRARTFPPYPGAYVRVDGRKIYLRLELLEENELDEGGRDPDDD